LEELWFTPNINGKVGVNPPAVAWLRERILSSVEPDGPPLRLYLSRAGAKRRRVLNEKALRPVWESFGFQTVVGHRLSFGEQVEMFSRAEAVVGAHGAALTNLLYSPPATRVLELHVQNDVHEHYYSLSAAAGHSYQAISGPGQINLWKQSDFTIDPGIFERALARLLA
jgi:capsular polysaccharide biosynthesis protein